LDDAMLVYRVLPRPVKTTVKKNIDKVRMAMKLGLFRAKYGKSDAELAEEALDREFNGPPATVEQDMSKRFASFRKKDASAFLDRQKEKMSEAEKAAQEEGAARRKAAADAEAAAKALDVGEAKPA
jgi:RNA:NAD 2'-phosphotransferase (TPT1/KptA family)